MKETWASDLAGTTLRITSTEPYSPFLRITREDTGEAIENVEGISIEARAGGVIWATLTLIHIDAQRREVQKEAVMVRNPALDLVARSSPAIVTRDIPVVLDTDDDGPDDDPDYLPTYA